MKLLQFDHWVIPSASPLCSLMSHDDFDHNPGTCESFVPPIIVGSRFARDLQTQYTEVRPNGSERFGGITFWLNYNRQLQVQGINPRISRFHSDWWYVSDEKSKVGILFIGNIDFPEVAIIEPFVDYILDTAKRALNAILLPSYGGVAAGLHGVPEGANSLALQQSIENVVKSIKAKRNGLRFAALPHPINASWSDFQFQRLRIRTRA